MQHGESECSGFAATSLGEANDVAAFEGFGDGLFLDGGRVGVVEGGACLAEGIDDALETVRVELEWPVERGDLQDQRTSLGKGPLLRPRHCQELQTPLRPARKRTRLEADCWEGPRGPAFAA